VVRKTGRRPSRRGRLWKGLQSRLDPAAFRPKLAEDVEIKEFRLRGGNDYAMAANLRDLIHLRLSPEDIELMRLMDGTRSVKDIVVQRFRTSGQLELDNVADLVRLLSEANFLETPFVDVYAAVRHAVGPSGLRQKARQFMKTLSIEWHDPQPVITWLYRHGLRWLFRPAAVAVLGGIAVAGLVAFGAIARSGRFSLAGRSVALEFLILGGLNYGSIVIHELGHALVITHYGRRVKSAGFEIYYGAPALFVDSSDGLMLERRQRMLQAFAGPLAGAVTGGVAAMVALAFPGAAISQTLYKFSVLAYFTTSINLIPLLELDGYWILSDLIQVPDLRPRSLAFTRYDLLPKLLRNHRLTRQEIGLSLFGTVGILFAGFAFFTAFLYWREVTARAVARMWNSGPVGQTLLLVLGVMVAAPVLQAVVQALRAAWRRLAALWEDLRFRAQVRWRLEAGRLIDELPLFEDLSGDLLSDVAGRLRLRRVASGEPVFRQGDRASAFYVVRRGTLQAVEEDPDRGTDRILRTLGPGQSFGELGLLEAAPRSATVRAVGRAEVFEIDKGTFDSLLADVARAPQFGPTLQAVVELRELPYFSNMEADELGALLRHGRWINVPPGDEIVQMGEVGDAFYALKTGQVEVLRDGTRISTLGPGSYFGEVALLLDVPRTATVRAVTPVRAYRLDREGFDRLLRGAFQRGTLNPHALVEREQRH
jgi:CRP-like cAMP-binding protein/Zn-dependent protease